MEKFARPRKGTISLEYLLLIVLIAGVIGGGIVTFGLSVRKSFDKGSEQVEEEAARFDQLFSK